MSSTYEKVEQIVAEILPTIPADELGRTAVPAASVASRLYAYVDIATKKLLSEQAGAAALAAPSDSRAKPWQYVARFWLTEAGASELVAETDPEIMLGTGEIADVLGNLSAELHGGTPDELKPDAVKERLPQFRNNLSRASKATLRIDYKAPDDGEEWGSAQLVSYRVQLDVYRLDT